MMKKYKVLIILVISSIFTLALAGCGFLWSSLSVNCTLSPNWQNVDDYPVTNFSVVPEEFIVNHSGSVIGTGYISDFGSNYTWLVRAGTAGQGWHNLDTYTYPGNTVSFASAVAVDLSDDIFVAGMGRDGLGVDHWVVRRSTNGGASWTNVDDFVYVAGQHSKAYGITIGLNGTIYVGGQGDDGLGNTYEIIRRSTNGGQTWATVDTFLYPGATTSTSYEIHVDRSNHVMSTGEVQNGLMQWFVRKSLDGGNTWSTADFYFPPAGSYAAAYGGGFDSSGNFYAVGNSIAASDDALTRMTPDLGTTWINVDDYAYPAASLTYWDGFGTDANNAHYSVGTYQDSVSSFSYWLVRKSSNGTTGWFTDDNYIYPGGTDTEAQKVLGDFSGNVFVAGVAQDSTGNYRWLVRSKMCVPND